MGCASRFLIQLQPAYTIAFVAGGGFIQTSSLVHILRARRESECGVAKHIPFGESVSGALPIGVKISAYGDALEIEFKKAGIPYVREDPIRIYYDGQELPTRYRADFTCYDRQYLVELNAIKTLTKVEWAQVIHYLHATQIPYALLLNFGQSKLQFETFDLASLRAREKSGGPEETSSGDGRS